MFEMSEPPTPSADDLSDIRFLTVTELVWARDTLVQALADDDVDEDSIRGVFDLLLDGGPSEAPA